MLIVAVYKNSTAMQLGPAAAQMAGKVKTLVLVLAINGAWAPPVHPAIGPSTHPPTHLSAELELEALLLQRALEGAAHLAILQRQNRAEQNSTRQGSAD